MTLPALLLNVLVVTANSPAPNGSFSSDQLIITPDNTLCLKGNVTITLCPQTSGSLQFKTDKAVFRGNGPMIFKRPRLLLDRRPYFVLPFLILLPKDQPGFLWPTLFWHPELGLVANGGIHVPLTKKAAADLRVGLVGRFGMSEQIDFSAPDKQATFAHFEKDEHHYLHTRIQGHQNLKNAVGAGFLVVDSSAHAAKWFTTKWQGRSRTHNEGRLRLSLDRPGVQLQNRLRYVTPFEPAAPRFAHMINHVSLSIAPPLFKGYFYPGVKVSLDTPLDSPEIKHVTPYYAQITPYILSLFIAAPILIKMGVATKVGVLPAVESSGQIAETRQNHRFAAAGFVSIAMPLAATGRLTNRLVEPALALYGQPIGIDISTATLDERGTTRSGWTLQATIKNTYRAKMGGPTTRLVLTLTDHHPTHGGRGIFLFGKLNTQSHRSSISTSMVYNVKSTGGSLVTFQLNHLTSVGIGAAVFIHYINPENGVPPVVHPNQPFTWQRANTDERALFVGPTFLLPFSSRLSGTAGLAANLLPSPTVEVATIGLELTAGCLTWHASLIAQLEHSSPLPSIFLAIGL